MRKGRQYNVAVVMDDNEFVRQMLAKMLEKHCEVIHVAKGADLLNTYLQHLPDLVFLDIHMPDLNGLDLIRGIKAVDKDAQIVMLTGDCTAKNVNIAKERGVTAFLAKPFEKKKVMDIVFSCPTIRFETEAVKA